MAKRHEAPHRLVHDDLLEPLDEVPRLEVAVGRHQPQHVLRSGVAHRDVRRHFREVSAKGLVVTEWGSLSFVLERLKAICGLVDAPFLWPMALAPFLKRELSGMGSSFDDNCIFYCRQ